MTAVLPGAGRAGSDQALLHFHLAGRRGQPVYLWLRGWGLPEWNCKRWRRHLRPRHGRRSELRLRGGAATIVPDLAPVTVITQPSPYPPGKLSVFVFEDDFPLNGEQDGGGGVDVLSPNEPGLGGFQIHLWDAMGGNGDFTGQMTYDMFNQPLTNSLAGTKDPNNGNDACPIGANELSATSGSATTTLTTDPTATGITGMIVTCPKYESDGDHAVPARGPGGHRQPDARTMGRHCHPRG